MFSRITLSAHRINSLALINDARTYLEVGVNYGATFFGVDIETRTGVDPKFMFDCKSLENERNHFFEVESDFYFQKIASRRDKFDIIFVDGLHTYEQTLRDFCSSLAHCHEKTIWLIDDVIPSDVFSALPDQDKAIYYRSLSGKTGDESWHGDVYKVVYTLHDFFPNMDFRTIADGGNPQTVVISRPRKAFSPKYNKLSTISDIGYFDLLEDHDLFNLDSEENILQWVREELSQ